MYMCAAVRITTDTTKPTSAKDCAVAAGRPIERLNRKRRATDTSLARFATGSATDIRKHFNSDANQPYYTNTLFNGCMEQSDSEDLPVKMSSIILTRAKYSRM